MHCNTPVGWVGIGLRAFVDRTPLQDRILQQCMGRKSEKRRSTTLDLPCGNFTDAVGTKLAPSTVHVSRPERLKVTPQRGEPTPQVSAQEVFLSVHYCHREAPSKRRDSPRSELQSARLQAFSSEAGRQSRAERRARSAFGSLRPGSLAAAATLPAGALMRHVVTHQSLH